MLGSPYAPLALQRNGMVHTPPLGCQSQGEQDLDTAMGELPPFPTARRGARELHVMPASPCTSRTSTQGCPGAKEQLLIPTRAMSAPPDTGDRQHLDQAKVKTTPRTQLQARRGLQAPPSAPAHPTSTTSPAREASRRSVSAVTFACFPLPPPGYFTQLSSKTKG